MLDTDAIRNAYTAHYTVRPRLIVRAPGRVNLIGEHTDYNGGYVLPVAIDRAVYVAARAREDNLVRCYAARFDAEDSFRLDRIERSAGHPWANYVRGMLKGLLARDLPVTGADMLIDGDVPLGSGLSSSAALEVAVGYAFQLLNNINLLGEELALLAQGAENNFVGVQSGIMDQFISVLGQADHALLIDCRNLDYRPVPLPPEVRIVVCDSQVPRTLAGSAYNERRRECEQAVQLLRAYLPKITTLRDVSLIDLERYGGELPMPVRARARHVVTENTRTLAGAEALASGDGVTFGRLMNASHTSLRDDYEVSIAELDTLTELARGIPGCYGSRLTGAGFGGCTVSLVDEDAVERFVEAVGAGYRQATGREALVYVCRASDGVGRAGA